MKQSNTTNTVVILISGIVLGWLMYATMNSAAALSCAYPGLKLSISAILDAEGNEVPETDPVWQEWPQEAQASSVGFSDNNLVFHFHYE